MDASRSDPGLPAWPLPAALALGVLCAAWLLPPAWRPGATLLLALAALACRPVDWRHRFDRCLVAGLLACGAGDLLLSVNFKVGLMAMAAGQALFALALAPEARHSRWRGVRTVAVLAALPAAWVAAVQVPRLPPSLALIALAYCAASAAMCAQAACRARLHVGWDTLGAASGALLFAGSDVLITLQHDLVPLPAAAQLAIPALYGLAQVLLGALARPLSRDANQRAGRPAQAAAA